MKRILMVLESEFKADYRVENEIEQLIKLGNEVTVACYSFSGNNRNEKRDGYTIVRKKISSFIYKTSVGALKFDFYFNFWKKYLSSLLEKQKYDVIHIHDLPLAKVGLDLRKKYGIPVIMDLHENWPALVSLSTHTQTFLGKLLSSEKQWRSYEKEVLGQVDWIITVIEEAKERLSGIGIDSNKIEVVSNHLNLNTFPDLKRVDSKEITLFYGGGINYHRGLQFVIDGMTIVKKEYPNISLIIVGGGNYVGTLEKQVKELLLEGSIKFLGWMSQNDLFAEMMKATIALIPHMRSEHTNNTIPNKIFQHMYAQIPTLSTNCDPLKRIIEKEGVGLVYEHNSPKDFAEKLQVLITDNADNKYGVNGKQAVIEKYNWEAQRSILEKFYAKIV